MEFFDNTECEWSDMMVVLGGAPLTKIRGLKYKSSKAKELLYAQGDAPISIQSGNRSYEGEIKILKGALEDMNTAALAAKGKDILDLEFDIVVTYIKKGIRPLQTDILVRCQVKEFQKGWDQGAKMMEVTLPIIFLQLISK
jgi:hypothetical protein